MPESFAQPPKATRRSFSSHPGRWLLVTLVILVLIWAGAKAARLLGTGRVLLADLRTLQRVDLASLSDLDPANLAELREHFASLEANLASVEAQVGPLLPLARHLGWLPRIGDEAAASPDLLELASSVATAGRAAMDGAVPVLAAMQAEGEGDATARMLQALQGTVPQWLEAKQALQVAAGARAQLDMDALDPRLGSQLARLDAILPMLQAGVSMAALAPSLLGADGPQSYLLMPQNSDELRATGGFISGVGLLEIDGGQILDLTFDDSYSVYNPDVDHPLAPPDLERYMGAQMLLFRDANWSPDFEASAAVARSLYSLDTGRETDGVIAFDVEAARRIVAAMAPLSLPGYAEPVTGENLITAMRAVWAAPPDAGGTAYEGLSSDWWLHRKDFMGDLAATARDKVEAGDVDFGSLLWALKSSLDEKHVLVSLDNPEAKTILSEMGWDGAIRPGDQDYLFVVDSNVGWNKVNPLVDRQTTYRVELPSSGPPQATLELIYAHGGQPTEEPCVHEPPIYEGAYEMLTRRCYFNYVRVYVPQGAQLISAEGFEPETVQMLPGERGTTVLSGFVVLRPGDERRVRLVYELPPTVVREDLYRLMVQKQAGTPTRPLQVELSDAGATWRPVSLSGVAETSGMGLLLDLAGDREIVFERTD